MAGLAGSERAMLLLDFEGVVFFWREASELFLIEDWLRAAAAFLLAGGKAELLGRSLILGLVSASCQTMDRSMEDQLVRLFLFLVSLELALKLLESFISTRDLIPCLLHSELMADLASKSKLAFFLGRLGVQLIVGG